MTAADARAVAAWRYPGDYSFYDADADADDLAELLSPAEWGQRYFAADQEPGHELAGLVVVKLSGRVAEIGLGLRPDLTGLGLGESLVGACLRFAAETLGAERYTLAVAAFNQRAITVYQRAGFREVERYEHVTNGGLHTFVRMARGPIGSPHLRRPCTPSAMRSMGWSGRSRRPCGRAGSAAPTRGAKDGLRCTGTKAARWRIALEKQPPSPGIGEASQGLSGLSPTTG